MFFRTSGGKTSLKDNKEGRNGEQEREAAGGRKTHVGDLEDNGKGKGGGRGKRTRNHGNGLT